MTASLRRRWFPVVAVTLLLAVGLRFATTQGAAEPSKAKPDTQPNIAESLAAADPPSEQPAKPNPKAVEGAEDVDLAAFMRKKLDASSLVLEGLCTEDMALVKRGAEQLKELGAAERFRVLNDVMYRQFNNEFRSVTDELLAAAEKGNPDRVALKWVDATMNCLDCHRYVRGVRVAEGEFR